MVGKWRIDREEVLLYMGPARMWDPSDRYRVSLLSLSSSLGFPQGLAVGEER